MSNPIFVLHPSKALQAVNFVSPHRLRGILTFLCFQKKKMLKVQGPTISHRKQAQALSPIFVHSAIVDSSPTTAPAFKLSCFCSGNGHNSPFLHIGSLFWTLSASYNPRTQKKKKTAREWTQGPHQREHSTDLMN